MSRLAAVAEWEAEHGATAEELRAARARVGGAAVVTGDRTDIADLAGAVDADMPIIDV